ncbi:hypothetical protein ABZ863_21350 [Saccharomonospora sp. NPDC046836]|uniref:hypothetical protein n=1 Tax=Saccharomonospora sp. NPDC046836 TaxID=3156921 RepID=UPI0033E72A9E
MTSSGVAAAGTVGGGKGSSSTEAASAQVLELRDQLARVAYAGDVKGTQDTLAALDPLLTDLAVGQVYSIQAEAKDQAGMAKDQQSEASRILADSAAEPRAYTNQLPGLPGLPDPLSMLNGLLQGLLDTLKALLGSLLGALPVPALPPLPVPVPVP